MSQSFQILIPVGEPRGHDHGNFSRRSLRGRNEFTVASIGEAAFAEYKADLLLREKIVALIETRGLQRAPASLLKNGGEHAAVFEIRRDD